MANGTTYSIDPTASAKLSALADMLRMTGASVAATVSPTPAPSMETFDAK